MRTVSVLVGLLLSPAALAADHVVYLDFDSAGFDLHEFSSTFTAADVELAKDLILYQVAKDFANVEVTVTREEPERGRYSRIVIGGVDAATGRYGTVSTATTRFGHTGTGVDSWEELESVGFVLSDQFATESAWQGSFATLARIANAVGHQASHEAGHLFGMVHDHTYDDYPTNTSLNDLTNHLMSTIDGGYNLTTSIVATRDRYFGHEVESEILVESQQARGYHQVLPDLDGDGKADLLTGFASSPTSLCWAVGESLGTAFDSIAYQECDAGDAGDLFLVGDVDRDGEDDLVIGEITSPTVVTWSVARGDAGDLLPATQWIADAGQVGDVFRLADVTGDQRADLLVGRVVSATQVSWYTFPATTSSTFGPAQLWVTDAGNLGDLFFFTDVDGDLDADMVYGRYGTDDKLDWNVRRSSGTTWGSSAVWAANTGERYDRVLVADVTGDNDADLVIGTSEANYEPGGTGSDHEGSNVVSWNVHYAYDTQNQFLSASAWSSDMGNPGDTIRLGDATGSRSDLVVIRRDGPTTVPVYVSVSSGSGFGAISGAWLADGGGEGWIVP